MSQNGVHERCPAERRPPRLLIIVVTSVIIASGLVGVGSLVGFGPIPSASAATGHPFGGHHHRWRGRRTPQPGPSGSATATRTGKPASPASPTRATSPTGGPPSSAQPDPTADTARSEVIRLVNVERAKAGCQALAANTALTRAAQDHSADMANRNYFAHDTLGGGSFASRITAAGYRWSGAAENIASGQRTPASVMESWMNSSGHRANIVNCGYRDIGVGVAANATGTLYWTQDFASPW